MAIEEIRQECRKAGPVAALREVGVEPEQQAVGKPPGVRRVGVRMEQPRRAHAPREQRRLGAQQGRKGVRARGPHLNARRRRAAAAAATATATATAAAAAAAAAAVAAAAVTARGLLQVRGQPAALGAERGRKGKVDGRGEGGILPLRRVQRRARRR